MNKKAISETNENLKSRMSKRDFIKKIGIGAAAALGAPYVMGASKSQSGGECKPTRAHRSEPTS